jgi:hypothetical protein
LIEVHDIGDTAGDHELVHPLHFLFPIDSHHDLFETFHRRLEVLDDVIGQEVRVRQIAEVGKTFILDPGNIEAGLVAVDNFLIRKLAPAAFGIALRVPGLFSFFPVGRVITLDKILEVFKLQRRFLEGMADVGPVIVYPDLTRPVLRSFSLGRSSLGQFLMPAPLLLSGTSLYPLFRAENLNCIPRELIFFLISLSNRADSEKVP